MEDRWQRVYDRDGYCCVYCKIPLDEDVRVFHSGTEDHLFPQAQRGSSRKGAGTEANVVCDCHVCNSLKGDFVPEMAQIEGVVIQTPRGTWQIAPEHRESYVRAVAEEIERRLAERKKLFDAERKRRNKT
jgi:hypothetical protein